LAGNRQGTPEVEPKARDVEGIIFEGRIFPVRIIPVR